MPSVAEVTGSEKSPPGGETAPTTVTLPSRLGLPKQVTLHPQAAQETLGRKATFGSRSAVEAHTCGHLLQRSSWQAQALNADCHGGACSTAKGEHAASAQLVRHMVGRSSPAGALVEAGQTSAQVGRVP